MPIRLFIVGTDTGVGKTAVTAALLRTAADRPDGPRLLPFKPAQSGDDHPSDTERLLDAARLPATDIARACPLRFGPPLAPGLAENRDAFVHPKAPASTPLPAKVERTLLDWEAQHQPDITLIEGAGGLHVPMPGGTWQPQWIEALSTSTLVVGRTGLGTINHTVSTIEALRALGRPPGGFILSQPQPDTDPSVVDNAAVIAARARVPHLGTLPFVDEPATVPELLDAVLAIAR